MNNKRKKSSWKWRLAQKLELKWWDQYLGKQDVAPYLKAKKAYWSRILDQLQLDIPANAQILDAGCGPAGIFTILNRQAVTAVDPLLNQYEKQLPHFQTSWYPNVHFANQQIEDLEAEYPFDFIFCLNAINHVDDIQLALQRLVAVAKEGSQIVISTDLHRSTWLMRLFQFIPGDVLHPHQYNLSGYQLLFQENGIHIQKSFRLKKGGIFDYWVFIGEKRS